jgi:hypothetical protein
LPTIVAKDHDVLKNELATGVLPSNDGSARLEINPSQAEIINRIYRLYAESSFSMKRIAHTLNSEGVPAPQPQKGRFSRLLFDTFC